MSNSTENTDTSNSFDIYKQFREIIAEWYEIPKDQNITKAITCIHLIEKKNVDVAQLENISEILNSHGYSVNSSGKFEVLHVIHKGVVNSKNTDENSKELSKIADDLGWKYVGWQCNILDLYTGETTGLTSGTIH